MKYVIDIGNDKTLALGDSGGLLAVTLTPNDSFAGLTFYLNDPQLEDLIYAIELVKSRRPKKVESKIDLHAGPFTHRARTDNR